MDTKQEETRCKVFCWCLMTRMIRPFTVLFVAGAFCSYSALSAASSDSATITFTISSINQLALSGSPAALNITTATAGSNPTSASDSSTSYSLTTNGTGLAISAALNTAMPTGLSLSVSMGAPTGGSSAGAVTLTTSSQNLVTNIANIAQGTLGITYQLSATAAAAPQGPLTRTVTFTLGP